MLRNGLERPVSIRILDHVDGFRIIRLAFYIRESLEVGRRHVPPISEAVPGLWSKRIKLHIYEGNESEYSPRTCSIGRPAGGTLCPPPLI